MKNLVLFSFLALAACTTPKWADKKDAVVAALSAKLPSTIPADIGTELTNCVATVAVTEADALKCPVPKDDTYTDILEPLNECVKGSNSFRMKFLGCLRDAQQALLERAAGE